MAGIEVDSSTKNVIRLCELRLRQDPDDPDALFAKAAVFAGLGLYSDALECIERLSAEAEDYPGLRLLKERVLVEMRRSPTSEAVRHS